jgi:hypothetical protein
VVATKALRKIPKVATKGASITNQLISAYIKRLIPQMATRAIGVASDMDDIGKQDESDTLIGEIGKSHATHEYLNFT